MSLIVYISSAGAALIKAALQYFSKFYFFPSTQSSDTIFMRRFPNLRKCTLGPVLVGDGGGDISKRASRRPQIEIKLLLAPERRAVHTGMGVALGKLGRVGRSCRGT